MNGRKIEVYLMRANPLAVFIDVMQKEGDCPKGYDLKKRLSCPHDCQNTYLNFAFDIVNKEIIGEGALLNYHEWHYNYYEMLRNGFDPGAMEPKDFVRQNLKNMVYKVETDLESLLYGDEQLCFRPVCRFQGMKSFVTDVPEINAYQNRIRNHTIDVIKEGGIEFHGPDGRIITHRFKDNVRG